MGFSCTRDAPDECNQTNAMDSESPLKIKTDRYMPAVLMSHEANNTSNRQRINSNCLISHQNRVQGKERKQHILYCRYMKIKTTAYDHDTILR